MLHMLLAEGRLRRRGSGSYGGVDPVTAGFNYDNGPNAIGRLTAQYDNGIALESYTYDAMGRVTGTRYHDYEADYGDAARTEQGMQVQYDLAGHPTQLIYPDGRTVKQSWDGAGRLATVTDAGTGEVYLSGGSSPSPVQYFPSGAVMSSVSATASRRAFSRTAACRPATPAPARPCWPPSPAKATCSTATTTSAPRRGPAAATRPATTATSTPSSTTSWGTAPKAWATTA